jgi:plastocyanin
MAFDKRTISVYAGSNVIINFDNRDAAAHNFALYVNSSAPQPAIFQGQIVNGPGMITYRFLAPIAPGVYFFRCDVHPTTMTGTFIVVGTVS